MPIVQDPILQINSIKTGYVSGSFKHSKGIAKRNVAVDSEGDTHITEDKSTAKGAVNFELFSSPENEILFKEWVANGDNNLISFIRGSINTNGSNMVVVNPEEIITYGDGEKFPVMFEGKPLVE